MRISDLYITEIDCSKYNFTIDETITVTVRLLDFNNYNPVKNKEVTVTVDKGVFTTNNSNKYTGNTNSNGEVVLTYKPNSWGTRIFRCNDTIVKARIVGGWKTFTPKILWGTIYSAEGYYNEREAIIKFYGVLPKVDGVTPLKILSLPSSENMMDLSFLKPLRTVCVPPHLCLGEIYLDNEGFVRCITGSEATHWQTIHYLHQGVDIEYNNKWESVSDLLNF